ncbi:MAG TPA: hypothetical protein VLS90_04660 [Thermodesulfobacteriota bacterium]|nr:hypothetical protein [Thermodesulfobacteriota bacterium]
MPRVRRGFHRRMGKKKAPPKTYRAACALCKRELVLEVQPTGKDLLCIDCFQKKGVLE